MAEQWKSGVNRGMDQRGFARHSIVEDWKRTEKSSEGTDEQGCAEAKLGEATLCYGKAE